MATGVSMAGQRASAKRSGGGAGAPSVAGTLLLGGSVVAATAAHWALLWWRLPLLADLPGWFYPFRDGPPGPWWLVALLLATLALAVVMTLRPRPLGRTRWSLLVLVLAGASFQYGFAGLEGRGLDALRARMTDAGHAEFARIAVDHPDSWSLLTRYEELQASGDLGRFAPSKPPGTTMWYVLSERAAHAFRPHTDARQRLAWSVTFASLTWPLLGYLVLLPLYSLGSALMDERRARLACLLYIVVPSVTLVTLHADQTLFPLLVMSSAALLARGVVDRRPVLAVAAGVAAYLAAFSSFALLAALPLGAAVILGCHAGRGWSQETRRSMGTAAAGLAGGFVGTALLFRLVLGYEMLTRYRGAMTYHAGFQDWESTLETYLTYARVDLLEFATWLGVPVAMLALAHALRSARAAVRGDLRGVVPSSLAVAGLIVAFLLLGKAKGEVARLWLFLVPWCCLMAADVLGVRTGRRAAIVVAAVAVLQWGSIYLIKVRQDFW